MDAAAVLENECSAMLASLASASRKLAKHSLIQSSCEHEIHSMCNRVWTVVQQQYSVSGQCGDQQQYTVEHQYSQQVAVVDADRLDALAAAMNTHLAFATSELASAIFEHTIAEERLHAFVLDRALCESRALAPARTHAALYRTPMVSRDGRASVARQVRRQRPCCCAS